MSTDNTIHPVFQLYDYLRSQSLDVCPDHSQVQTNPADSIPYTRHLDRMCHKRNRVRRRAYRQPHAIYSTLPIHIHEPIDTLMMH